VLYSLVAAVVEDDDEQTQRVLDGLHALLLHP